MLQLCYVLTRRFPNSSLSHSQNSTGPWTEGQLSGFRPHSSYEISVLSYTRVGHGDQYSTPVSFTTNESGMYVGVGGMCVWVCMVVELEIKCHMRVELAINPFA